MTAQSIEKRWSQHKAMAYNKKKQHPFYNAIRKYGADNFTIDILAATDDVSKAKELEIQYIASENAAYNLSRGGDYDTIKANEVRWNNLRSDPEAFQSFKDKVSDSAKRYAVEHPERIDKLQESKREWVKNNPKQAWKQAHRAARLMHKANRKKPIEQVEERPSLSKMELLAKFNPTKAQSLRAKQGWEHMSKETKEDRRKKIGEASKRQWARLTDEQRKARVQKMVEARKKNKTKLET